MKKFVKNWIVPPGYLELYHKTRHRKTVKEATPLVDTSGNVKYKDRHKGERCFILASGPSIANQDLTILKDELCIAVSHFHLHKDIKIIKPRFHVLAPQHHPFTFADSSKYFEDFLKAYDGFEVDYFLGVDNYEYNYINLLNTYEKFSLSNVNYLNYERGIILDEPNYLMESLWDISSDRIFVMRTVVYGAIQVAIYMGFKEIYLLGCDHDYLNDISRTTNHHFYKEEKGISDKLHLSQFTRERWFFEYYMRWRQYRLMKEYAETKDTEIFNATDGGMLDVFERKNLKEVLNNNA